MYRLYRMARRHGPDRDHHRQEARRRRGVAVPRYAFLPFLTDCVIVLEHRVVEPHGDARAADPQVPRGRPFLERDAHAPLLVGHRGRRPAHVGDGAPGLRRRGSRPASRGSTRCSTAGYLRGTCTLVSGAPGTSKTSLAGAFAEAACGRGERTLFVSFDEAGEAIVRNLASVNIRLGALRAFRAAAHLLRAGERHARRRRTRFGIGALLDEHQARCLVVDPVSALIHAGASEFAGDAVLGLLDLAKRRGDHRAADRLPARRLRSDPGEQRRRSSRPSPTPGCTCPTWPRPASAIAP